MRSIIKYTIPLIFTLITISCNKTNYGHYNYTTDENFVLLIDSLSPNGKYKYLKYKYDYGVLGESNEIWAVTSNEKEHVNLRPGLIPKEYKIKGWSTDNSLLIEKDETIVDCGDPIELLTGMKYNGVAINVVNK